MKILDIIRFWKSDMDDELPIANEEKQSQLPLSPVGHIELKDEDLEQIAGGPHHTDCCNLGEQQ